LKQDCKVFFIVRQRQTPRKAAKTQSKISKS
jgi:hypothetical protein